MAFYQSLPPTLALIENENPQTIYMANTSEEEITREKPLSPFAVPVTSLGCNNRRKYEWGNLTFVHEVLQQAGPDQRAHLSEPPLPCLESRDSNCAGITGPSEHKHAGV